MAASYLKTEPGGFYVKHLEFLSPLNFCCQAEMSVSQTGLSASQFSGDVSMSAIERKAAEVNFNESRIN